MRLCYGSSRKVRVPLHWSIVGVLISLSQAIEPRWLWDESVTHDQCDARHAVTFPLQPQSISSPHFGRYTNLLTILLGEQRHMCVNNLPRVVMWSGATRTRTCDLWLQVRCLSTTPPVTMHATCDTDWLTDFICTSIDNTQNIIWLQCAGQQGVKLTNSWPRDNYKLNYK